MKFMYSSLLCLLLVLLTITAVKGQSDAAITTPVSGSAIQGKVDVRGYIKATNFFTYDLDFSHGQDSESGWFNITTSNINPEDGLLGIWDTSSISDGNYKLRLTVRYKDDTKSETTIEEIRVRNYSLIETDTPNPGVTDNIEQGGIGNPTFPVPTPFGDTTSRNEVEITRTDFFTTLFVGLGFGVLLTILLIVIFKTSNE